MTNSTSSDYKLLATTILQQNPHIDTPELNTNPHLRNAIYAHIDVPPTPAYTHS